MVRAKNNSNMPPSNGQTVDGFPSTVNSNPHNAQARRPDVLSVTSDGDGGMVQPGMVGTSTSFPRTPDANTAQKGTDSTVPTDAVVNDYYTQIQNVGPSALKNTGANRQRFGISPGDLPQPEGASPDRGPTLPDLGVGGTGNGPAD